MYLKVVEMIRKDTCISQVTDKNTILLGQPHVFFKKIIFLLNITDDDSIVSRTSEVLLCLRAVGGEGLPFLIHTFEEVGC